MTTTYILGAGAIGLGLAVKLQKAGRPVHLIQTRPGKQEPERIDVTLTDGKTGEQQQVTVPISTLADTPSLDGIVALTTKAHANETIAEQLKDKGYQSPIVLMQNGIGIETPFLEAGFPEVYRCILYSASHRVGRYEVQFKKFRSSQVGLIRGSEARMASVIAELNSAEFPFHAEPNIQHAIWTKGIINCVYNTICPLLEVDNGVFTRDSAAVQMAERVISECVTVANAIGIALDKQAVLDDVMSISRITDGQLASTLQDLQYKRETEIASLNLAIVKIAEGLDPIPGVSTTRTLGELVHIKSRLHR